MQAHRQNVRSRFGRPRAAALAVAALMYSVAALMVRALPLSNNLDLVIAVSSLYAPLVALSGLGLSILSRRNLLVVAAVSVVTITIATQLPWYYFGRSPNIGEHVDIRVLSSNLRKGQADASSFVVLAEASADVIAVAELTQEEVVRLSEAGIEAAFPYSLLRPGLSASGIGLWSRYPLIKVPTPNKPYPAARLLVPGVRFHPLFASVHISSPVARDSNSFGNWRDGVALTRVALHDFAAAAGPAAVIVAGDFNSTPDMKQFRDLLTNGYHDAVEQTGAGLGPTFPSNLWTPPFITIDHVFTRNAVVSSIRTVEMPGSDHRSLLAVVQAPVEPQHAD